MLTFAGNMSGGPTRNLVGGQVEDPFKKWIDGEILTNNTFDDFHNYLLGTNVFENTDPLIKERGFRILDKMLDTDPNIKNGYWNRIFTILSEEARIDPSVEGCARSEEINEFVKWNLDSFMQKSMHSFLRKMLDSSRQGFKIAEIVWKVIEEGKYRGMIGLYDLIVRDSRNYSFLTDCQGRIDPMGVIEGISSTGFHIGDNPRQLPTNKFVIYTYNALNDDAASIYGNSDFRSLWRPFYGDTTAHRLEMRSAETFARPPLLGTMQDGEYTKPDQAKVQKDMAGAYNRTYTQVPSGVKIEELGVKRSDTQTFRSLSERHDRQVRHGMMMGAQGAVNDREAAQVQTQMFLIVLDAIGIDLSKDVVQRQIIKRIVDLNYRTSKYPVFSIPRLSTDRNKRMEFLEKGIGKGVLAPDEPWMRGFLNVPKQDLATRGRQMSVKHIDQISLSSDEAFLLAASREDGKIRQVPSSIHIEEKQSGMVLLKENDNGQISIRGRIKAEFSVSDLETRLEEIVDQEPQNRFLLAKIIGRAGEDSIMQVVRVVAPGPKDRIVMVDTL